jgi:hypothetical protein
MLSCICGNTDLEKVGVNLLRSNDAESLQLVALLCRGDGCGRVTFRPNPGPSAEAQPSHVPSPEFTETEMTKTKRDIPVSQRDIMKQLIALFEQVYTERLVYKVIAERDPACGTLLEALKSDEQIRQGIALTFVPIYDSIERDEDLIKLLQSLPSTRNGNAVPALAAAASPGRHR